jgi:hypothetical protein
MGVRKTAEGCPNLNQAHKSIVVRSRLWRSFGCQLAKNRLSDNAGGVNDFLSTRLHALRKERHFALADELCATNPKLARNPFQVRTLGPAHASLRS